MIRDGFQLIYRNEALFVKKILCFILVSALALSAGVSAYADQQSTQAETIAVSLGTIETIMTTYNLDVKAAANNLETARETYKYSEKERYDKDTYASAQNTYADAIQQKIVGAKQTYLTYCADVSALSAAQTASDNDQKGLSVSAEQLSQGYLSQKDYNTCLETAQKSKDALQTLDAKVTQEKKALRTLLNIPSQDAMDIRPAADSDFDFSGIPKINYGEDVIVMMENNLAIQSESMTYATVKKEIASSRMDVENAQISLEQTENNQKAAFKGLYDTLVNSYAAYQQEVQKVQRGETEAAAEKQKLALGYVSQKKYDDTAAQLQSLKSTLESDRGTLSINYLKYSNMKSGYTAAGGAVS